MKKILLATALAGLALSACTASVTVSAPLQEVQVAPQEGVDPTQACSDLLTPLPAFLDDHDPGSVGKIQNSLYSPESKDDEWMSLQEEDTSVPMAYITCAYVTGDDSGLTFTVLKAADDADAQEALTWMEESLKTQEGTTYKVAREGQMLATVLWSGDVAVDPGAMEALAKEVLGRVK